MKPEDLEKLFQEHESETLELLRVPNTSLISSSLTAFANTNGGKMIIGKDEDHGIVGIDNIERVRQIVDKAADTILPSLKIDIETAEVGGKKVLVVDIPKGENSPYFANGIALQRVGAYNVPITSEVLVSSINERSTSVEDLRTEIRRLSNIIEKLNKELILARSWKKRLTDMVMGGFIGWLIGVVISFVIM